MNYSISKIFHQATKVKYKDENKKLSDPKNWPKQWKTIYFKSYPRLPKIFLPKIEKLDFSLGKSLINRQSEREFSGEQIKLKDLSQLLFYSAGVIKKNEDNQNKGFRAYPSGGARFPLEIYLFSLQESSELEKGIYHYNVKEHFLEKLFGEKNLRKEIYPKAIWQEMILKAPLVLVISAIFWRTTMKYKDRGYRYILLEAGHLGENIYLTSTALGIKCCAIGGFGDDELHKILDIDGKNEAILYAFALGN